MGFFRLWRWKAKYSHLVTFNEFWRSRYNNSFSWSNLVSSPVFSCMIKSFIFSDSFDTEKTMIKTMTRALTTRTCITSTEKHHRWAFPSICAPFREDFCYLQPFTLKGRWCKKRYQRIKHDSPFVNCFFQASIG